MSALSEPLSLAAGFPPASREQWRVLVAATLARSGTSTAEFGENPQDALNSVTADGIVLAPLYTSADPGAAPMPRQFAASAESGTIGWDVRQRHADPDPVAAATAIADDLANGVTSLWLAVGGGRIAVADLPTVLDGVRLQSVPIVLDAGAAATGAAAGYLDLLASQGADPQAASGNLGVDPIGWAARSGAAVDLSQVWQVCSTARDYPAVRAVTVDASVYHDAGGSDAEELAVGASVAVAYLRELVEAGLGIADALAEIDFRYAVTVDQFASMAKLRAARAVWRRIAEIAGAPAAARGQRQHAVTSAGMMTVRDRWVNVLRATVACFAAAVGGAQAITVAPFDSAVRLPDEFARRLARNTQAVLLDEANVARVADPANGSWYVESYTRRLAESAWSTFTALERGGGAAAAWQSGMIAELLTASRERKVDRIRRLQDPIVGVSAFPAGADDFSAERPGVSLHAGGLTVLRDAADFERMRSEGEVLSGTVFLAALGPAKEYSARLEFFQALLAIAGVHVVVGADSGVGLAAAFAASESKVACLCSSDALYADLAGPAAATLKAAGAERVWIAGPPSLAAGPVDAAVWPGCDAVAALEDMLATVAR